MKKLALVSLMFASIISCVTLQTEKKDIYGLTNQKEEIVFTDRFGPEFSLLGGTFDYAREILSIRDKEGKPVFLTEYEIFRFKKEGGDVDYARSLVSLGFDNYHIWAYKYFKGNLAFADHLISYNFSPETVCDFQAVKGFDAEKIAYIDNMIASDPTGKKIAKWYKLGIDDILSFDDTSKPNAIFEFPVYDTLEKALSSLIVNQIYKELKNYYDVYTLVAEEEDDFYAALDLIPDIEAVFGQGHGTETSLRFCKGNDEKYTLDTSDYELKKHIHNLKNATFVLFSCLTGAGGDSNLADFLISQTGCIVIAPTESITGEYVRVESYLPLSVRFINPEDKSDVTYFNKQP